MKKFIAFLLAVTMILSCSILTGCSNDAGKQNAAAAEPGSSAAAGEKPISGKITLWTNNSSSTTTYFTAALERFSAEYPEIKVTLEQFPDYATKVSQAFAAGDEGDVVFTWQSVADWAKAGKVLPVPENVYSKEEMENTFYAGAIKNKMYDGQYYMVSNEINVESPTLFVNMDILEQKGIALPEGWIENNGPETWEELVAFAKTLNEYDGKGNLVFSGLSYAYAQWEAQFESLIFQYGGDFRDEANNTVHFQTPEAKSAAEFLLKYLTPGEDQICVGTTGRSEDFEMMTCAMCIGAPWYASTFDSDIPDTNYQVFNVPPFVEGADPVCLATGGWGYCVSANTEYPEACWALVKFLTSAYEDGEWAYTTGALPSHKEALNDLTYDPNVGSKDKAIALSKLVLDYAEEDGAYLLTASTLTYTIIREGLYQLLEDRDVDSFLATIQSRTEQMIADNNSR